MRVHGCESDWKVAVSGQVRPGKAMSGQDCLGVPGQPLGACGAPCPGAAAARGRRRWRTGCTRQSTAPPARPCSGRPESQPASWQTAGRRSTPSPSPPSTARSPAAPALGRHTGCVSEAQIASIEGAGREGRQSRMRAESCVKNPSHVAVGGWRLRRERCAHWAAATASIGNGRHRQRPATASRFVTPSQRYHESRQESKHGPGLCWVANKTCWAPHRSNAGKKHICDVGPGITTQYTRTGTSSSGSVLPAMLMVYRRHTPLPAAACSLRLLWSGCAVTPTHWHLCAMWDSRPESRTQTPGELKTSAS